MSIQGNVNLNIFLNSVRITKEKGLTSLTKVISLFVEKNPSENYFNMAGTGLGKEVLQKFYKDFLRVCERWPVHTSRSGRDFGEHMRETIGNRLKEGDVDPMEARRTVDALMKISTNYYRDKYPRKREIAYTSQAADVYEKVLSNDGQSQVEPRRTWWERFSKKKKLNERLRDSEKNKGNE